MQEAYLGDIYTLLKEAADIKNAPARANRKKKK
jgi:hypothetical protein